MAESSWKNECAVQDNSPASAGSLTLAERFSELQIPLEGRKVEENSQDPIPMIVESSAARSGDNPDTEEKRNSSVKRNAPRFAITGPITLLDPWNKRRGNMSGEQALLMNLETNLAMRQETRKRILKLLEIYERKRRDGIDAWKLREKRPDSVPVAVEKDAKSDLPDMDMKKFLIPGHMPLQGFVLYVQRRIKVGQKKRVFLSFKNTQPPTDALISTIDAENKDEDGFLRITYSG